MPAVLHIDGLDRVESQFRILPALALFELGGTIAVVGHPLDGSIRLHYRKMRQAAVRADASVIKSILTVAPRPKHQAAVDIRIDNRMCPTWRHHYLFSRQCGHRHATPRIIGRPFLRIDDRLSLPYLEQFRWRPSVMCRNGVY